MGTRDPGSDHPRVGAEYDGPGAVQLWRVPPTGSGQAGAAAEAGPARLAKKARGGGAAASQPAAAAAETGPVAALVLAHSHGTVWDLKWRPHSPGAAPAAAGSLGLLAVACGDGTLCIVSVPDPRRVPPQAHGGSSHQPVALAMRPAWCGSRGPSGERRDVGCLPWCLAWHPQAPHDRLLAGCTDGTVLLYNLSGCLSSGSGTRAAPAMSLLSKATHPLRAVCWQPPAAGDAHGAHTLVAGAGDEGILSVWDPQQQVTPVWRCHAAHALSLALAWWPSPRMLVTAADNGRLGVHNFRLGAVASQAAAGLKGVNPGSAVHVRANALGLASWGLDLVPPCPGVADDRVAGLAAVCGADGGVAVIDPIRVLTQSRAVKAKKGAPAPKVAKQTSCTVAWLQAAVVDGGGEGSVPLVVTCGGAKAPEELLFESKTGGNLRSANLPAMDVHKAVATRPEQALHRCRWSGGEGDGQERWLAAAGAAGVLRLLRLRLKGREDSVVEGDEDEEDDDEEAEEVDAAADDA